MRFPYLNLTAALCIAAFGAVESSAQSCITITGLPDTVSVCKNSTFQLTPQVTVVTGATLQSTLWTPTSGLSNPAIPNPVVTVGTASIRYRLSVQAVSANAITNGDFSAGNSGFTTGYAPASGGTFGPLSTEGQYLVTTNAVLAHNNFASFTDHTGNLGGQMLVLNGSATANTSLWCQTFPVQPNTNYNFSAWGASAVASSPAVLQFSVNSVNLTPATTLPTATGVWTQFGGTWNSGAATSATVCITNTNINPSGNDFAVDDISARFLCSAADSVYVRVINLQPTFSSSIRFGCAGDTVSFAAGVSGGDTPDRYEWSFGDGATDTGIAPMHVYAAQGIYPIKLVVYKDNCADSFLQQVDLQHPLAAGFTQSTDTICTAGSVTFTNNSITTIRDGIGPKYLWTFGDGQTDTVLNPVHTYSQPGTYTVTLVVRDFVPCIDTAYSIVVVDSLPYVSVTTPDSALCEGQSVTLRAGYLAQGLETLTWIFGDGTTADAIARPVIAHGYDAPGLYNVMLAATYRRCPDTADTVVINIRPFPSINIGPDTAICPGGEPILLTARFSSGGAAADGPRIVWNTRDTAASILVRHHGDYWARAENGGCTTSDSVHVVKDCYLDMPNSFTPNSDGINDYFWPRQLLSEGIVSFKMNVYNRWGQKVWETTRIDGRGWDGKFNGEDQPTGVFIYMVEAELRHGFREKYQGNVTLLR